MIDRSICRSVNDHNHLNYLCSVLTGDSSRGNLLALCKKTKQFSIFVVSASAKKTRLFFNCLHRSTGIPAFPSSGGSSGALRPASQNPCSHSAKSPLPSFTSADVRKLSEYGRAPLPWSWEHPESFLFFEGRRQQRRAYPSGGEFSASWKTCLDYLL